MDFHLFGKYPQDTPAIRIYWESVFHVDDDITKPSNARFSTYQSFLRQSIKLLYANHSERTVGNGGGEENGCGIPKQAVVKDVSVLKQAELITGLVVTLKDALSGKLNPPEFEVYFTPVPMLKRHSLENELSRRIWALEVCFCIDYMSEVELVSNTPIPVDTHINARVIFKSTLQPFKTSF